MVTQCRAAAEVSMPRAARAGTGTSDSEFETIFCDVSGELIDAERLQLRGERIPGVQGGTALQTGCTVRFVAVDMERAASSTGTSG